MDTQEIQTRKAYYKDYYLKNKDKYYKKYEETKQKSPNFRKKKEVYGFKRFYGDFTITFD